jgi:hypothetical protein
MPRCSGAGCAYQVKAGLRSGTSLTGSERPDPLAGQPTRTQALLRKLTGGVSSRGHLGGFFYSGRCDAGVRWKLGGEACAQASAYVVYMGCLGEHVEPLELCEVHNRLIETVTLICVPCRETGHTRPMAVIKREMT